MAAPHSWPVGSLLEVVFEQIVRIDKYRRRDRGSVSIRDTVTLARAGWLSCEDFIFSKLWYLSCGTSRISGRISPGLERQHSCHPFRAADECMWQLIWGHPLELPPSLPSASCWETDVGLEGREVAWGCEHLLPMAAFLPQISVAFKSSWGFMNVGASAETCNLWGRFFFSFFSFNLEIFSWSEEKGVGCGCRQGAH